jgi:hypothetical protein
LARQRDGWWKRVNPNPDWAVRYGNKYELVKRYLDESVRHAQWEDKKSLAVRITLILLVVIVIAIVGGWFYSVESQRLQVAEESLRRRAAEHAQMQTQAALEAAERERAEADRARAEMESAFNKLSAEKRESDQLAREKGEEAATSAARQQEIDGLRQRLQQLELRRPLGSDDATQIAKGTSTQIAAASPSIANQDGYIWIGSVDKSKLSLDGVAASPTNVKVGEQYTLATHLYLRQGPPSDPGYVSQPSIGIVAQGSRIEARSAPIPYYRPSGVQYWLAAHVISSTFTLPTVYFQFATAPRNQAQEVSAALQEKGYKIPGEERSAFATGLRQVRYFYPQDKTAADNLAVDTTSVLQSLGYSASPPVVAEMTGKKNPPGIVELWLDLPTAKK